MAESKKSKAAEEKPETPKEAVKQTDPPEDSDSYPVERLTSEPGFLPDYEPHVIAGALATVDKKNLTIEETRAAVKTWLKSEVEVDDPQEA